MSKWSIWSPRQGLNANLSHLKPTFDSWIFRGNDVIIQLHAWILAERCDHFFSITMFYIYPPKLLHFLFFSSWLFLWDQGWRQEVGFAQVATYEEMMLSVEETTLLPETFVNRVWLLLSVLISVTFSEQKFQALESLHPQSLALVYA